jgi:hypothetical protein
MRDDERGEKVQAEGGDVRAGKQGGGAKPDSRRRYEETVPFPWGLLIYLVVLAVGTILGLLFAWPDAPLESGAPQQEVRLLLVVVLSGALGAYLHAATSAVTYLGNRCLVRSWLVWYYLRPPIGMVLALVFYFVIRGGLLASVTAGDPQPIDPFGVAAISALVGMFSKQATDKLRELFDDLFRTAVRAGDAERRDKLGEVESVEEVMVPVAEIVRVDLPEDTDDPEGQLKIADLYDKLGGRITRLPIFAAEGNVRYVIHQSLLYKFVADYTLLRREGEAGAPTGDARELTLRDFLAAEGMRQMVEEALAFVDVKATLGEAKRRMEETPRCQDVFVTRDGTRASPVVGWVTNVDIGRRMSA